jgi:hypothetical protein
VQKVTVGMQWEIKVRGNSNRQQQQAQQEASSTKARERAECFEPEIRLKTSGTFQKKESNSEI